MLQSEPSLIFYFNFKPTFVNNSILIQFVQFVVFNSNTAVLSNFQFRSISNLCSISNFLSGAKIALFVCLCRLLFKIHIFMCRLYRKIWFLGLHLCRPCMYVLVENHVPHMWQDKHITKMKKTTNITNALWNNANILN